MAERPVLRTKHLKFKQEFVDGHQPCSWKEWGPEGRVGTRPSGKATQSHAGAIPEPQLQPPSPRLQLPLLSIRSTL